MRRPAFPDPLRLPWAYLAFPGVLLLVAFFIFPIAVLALNSLFVDAGAGQFRPGVTLANYIRFFGDTYYLMILVNTLKLGFVIVTVSMVLAYPVAYFLARQTGAWRGFLIYLVVAPLFVSTVVRNLAWVPILSSNGPINWLLLKLGIISAPLILVNNFTGVVIGLTHVSLPFMILLLIPTIQRIAVPLEEASASLGATAWRTFWKVLLPLSKAGLVGSYLVVFTMTISAFTTPLVLGGQRVIVMSSFIERQFRSTMQYGFGATASMVLLTTVALLTLASMHVAGQDR